MRGRVATLTGKALFQGFAKSEAGQRESNILHHQFFELGAALLDGALIVLDLLELAA
jgi:hypothetical protein